MEYTSDYLIEKFKPAVKALVTGEGDARSRVRDAYGEFGHLRVEDAPKAIAEDLKWIFDRVYSYRRVDEEWQIVAATKLKTGMKNKTATKIAERIFRIYETIRRD